MTVRIIGISGYARSGKDLVRASLEARGYLRVALADQIQNSLFLLNPLVADSKRLAEAVNDYGWDKAKTAFPEIRRLLQRQGSEVGRETWSESFWIDLAFRNIPENSRIVVPDVRYPNEAEYIRSRGGQVWRVNHPNLKAKSAHKSETALDDYSFDHMLLNDSTPEYLDAKIAEIFTLDSSFDPVSDSGKETMNTQEDVYDLSNNPAKLES